MDHQRLQQCAERNARSARLAGMRSTSDHFDAIARYHAGLHDAMCDPRRHDYQQAREALSLSPLPESEHVR